MFPVYMTLTYYITSSSASPVEMLVVASLLSLPMFTLTFFSIPLAVTLLLSGLINSKVTV